MMTKPIINNNSCVLVDSREGKRIPQTIKYFGADRTEIKQLPTGDYCYIKDTKENNIDVAIEFKTAPDMINSIQNKRIFRQVRRLRTEFPNHYVIVLGNIVNYIEVMQKKARTTKVFNFDFTIEQWLGAYSSLEQVTRVLFANNFNQCLKLMDLVFKKCTDEKNRNYLYNEKISENPVTNYLASIQGIGFKTAEKVSNELEMNNLYDLLEIERENLLNLKGVGDKTTDLIIQSICEV